MLLQLFLLYLIRFREGALAAPLASSAARSSPGSCTDATGHATRTVLNIIWSCVTPIVACTWVAVHPNMPKPGAKPVEIVLNRFRIMVWMMIAPELVIFWAIRQWLGARKLKAKYHAKHSHWRMAHGYFIQMGGFMLYDKDGLKPLEVLTEDRLDVLLTKQSIKFPQITKTEIQDRSKRDALSKTVAIGQTLWFVAQCITRKAQGLHTTELELITVAFASLNIFVYYFWWGKPMDAQTAVPVCLLLEEMPTEKKEPEPSGSRRSSISTTPSVEKDEALMEGERTEVIHGSPSKHGVVLTATTAAMKFIFKILFVMPLKGLWALFHRLGEMTAFSGARAMGEPEQHVSRFYAAYCTNSERNGIVGSVSAIGMIFGAVHCIAWDFIFPSRAEALIWRVSSVIITAVPFTMALSAFLLAFVRTDEEDNPSGTKDTFFAIVGICVFLVGFLGILPYIIARFLLLVEAFVLLRDLPSSALLEVRWTSFLPHL